MPVIDNKGKPYPPGHPFSKPTVWFGFKPPAEWLQREREKRLPAEAAALNAPSPQLEQPGLPATAVTKGSDADAHEGNSPAVQPATSERKDVDPILQRLLGMKLPMDFGDDDR